MRRLLFSALVLASRAASADTSVGQPASVEPGWCLAQYLKEARRAAPPPATAMTTRTTSFRLGGVAVELDVPALLSAALIGEDVIQVAPGASGAEDEFPGWGPAFQVRWQTRAELETRVRAIRSDFMGTTRPRLETRPATFRGARVEEVCAIVRRTPGHATLLDGRHQPMPDIVELVHGYLIPVGDRTLGAVYRLTPQAIDEQPQWEQLLTSVRAPSPVSESVAVELIVVFNKDIPSARAEQILKELGYAFNAGGDSSRGKKYFYDHGAQFTVHVPRPQVGRFQTQVKKRAEIFEAYVADRSIQKD
jgi:hypothetical protein